MSLLGTIHQWTGRAHRDALERRIAELEDEMHFVLDPMIETERFEDEIEAMIRHEETNVVRLR